MAHRTYIVRIATQEKHPDDHIITVPRTRENPSGTLHWDDLAEQLDAIAIHPDTSIHIEEA
jgi:hypothetical protein